MLPFILLSSIVIFYLAYRAYGKFLATVVGSMIASKPQPLLRRMVWIILPLRRPFFLVIIFHPLLVLVPSWDPS